MRIALRWLGYAVAALLVVALLVAAWVWFASSRALAEAASVRPESLAELAAVDLADAERRARTLGCVSCHGEGLTGRPMIDDPKVARLHSPNLTVLAARASDQQLAQAIRQGVGVDGKPLFVMPSEAYQFLTDQEVAVLIAYIRSLPKRGAASPPPAIGPLGRIGIVTDKFQTAPALVASYRARPAADLSEQYGRGRHLAMTTCSGCHGSDLSGRVVSPEINAPSLDIAGAYDLEAFKRLLREGVAPPGREIREMARVAREDSRFYTDGEIAALHAYLVARAQRAQ
ncbi:MAG TPA: c-type cytochrome [Sphingomicrobium sp.]|nr:c-type cytochrome [Sphingomicrobium sp.]